jgi:hypothetical protein
MKVKPKLDETGAQTATIDFDPYTSNDLQQIVNAWLPFVVAMNSVSYAMGEGELYPFIIAPAVIKNSISFTSSSTGRCGANAAFQRLSYRARHACAPTSFVRLTKDHPAFGDVGQFLGRGVMASAEFLPGW